RQLIKKSGINLNDKFGQHTYLETFLAPTQLYVKPILELKKHVTIKAMNHITGGGFYENIPRALPAGYAARIDTTSFPTPKIFDWLQQQGNIDTNEMYNIFNMGIGYTVIVDEKDASRALKILAEQNVEAYQIGHIVKNESTAIELLGV
ncbi:AIR synthase-related protein, partial [Staphylococcus coagulans]